MRWDKKSRPTEEFIRMMAGALKDQKRMLQDNGIILAIETHFEFTTFELLRLFELCGARPGEYLGICLDTMNLLTMLEDPVWATERVLPWVVMTHIKDGGILISDEGFLSFTAEAGTGVIDFEAIFEKLSKLDHTVNLSLEDHGGGFSIPVFDPDFLAGFPDLTASETIRLVELSARCRELLERGKIAVLDRARWPEHCERRVKRGLRAVKRIVEEKSH
jgi:sugar phosphate isomerase/epimerase